MVVVVVVVVCYAWWIVPACCPFPQVAVAAGGYYYTQQGGGDGDGGTDSVTNSIRPEVRARAHIQTLPACSAPGATCHTSHHTRQIT